jgi:hypothetical protein
MSLTVQVFGPDGALEAPEPAGFQSYRTVVWGSQAARDLGARFFPQLAFGDLRVQPGEVEDFEKECALLRAHLDTIAPPDEQGRSRCETVAERLTIIEAAAARARSLGGGVVIS